jgi:hypothetical protein
MNARRLMVSGFLFFVCFVISVDAEEGKIFFREDFGTLDNWKPFYFPKTKKHTTYSIEKKGCESYLRTESDDSASALIFKHEFNVYEYPRVRWKWKVDNIYKKGNPYKKSGDDYPIRIYVLFKYDPEKASFLERLKFGIWKKLYGDYPPRSTLEYVWASRDNMERVHTSPFTERAKLVALEKGTLNVGRWMTEEVDIVKDYQEAFGERPPEIAGLGIMNDSDNTGERSVSYAAFIEIYRPGCNDTLSR